MDDRVAIKSVKGLEAFPVEVALGYRRNLFICDEISEEMAVEFIQKMMYMTYEDGASPIRVFINTVGGEINSGLLLYDAICQSKAPVQLYCIGKAYSMGAVLLAAGEKGSRFILPHSKVMIHEPLIPYGVGGKSSSVQTISESLLKTKKEMEELLARHTGKTPEEIAENTTTDHFFTADEAVEFGLVDKVITFNEMIEENL